MLKIRLQRTGRRNDPSFRLVVTEHTRGPKSQNHVDRVGFYNPKTKEQQLQEDRIKHWIASGAQPSPTVHNMLIKAGIIEGKTINVLPQKSPVVGEQPEGEEEQSSEEGAGEAGKEGAGTDEVAKEEEAKDTTEDSTATKDTTSESAAEEVEKKEG